MNRKISTLFTTGLLMAGSLCGSAFAQTTIQDLLGLGAQATELENGSRYVITNPNGEAYGFTELNAGTKLLKEDVCDITSADINKDGVADDLDKAAVKAYVWTVSVTEGVRGDFSYKFTNELTGQVLRINAAGNAVELNTAATTGNANFVFGADSQADDEYAATGTPVTYPNMFAYKAAPGNVVLSWTLISKSSVQTTGTFAPEFYKVGFENFTDADELNALYNTAGFNFETKDAVEENLFGDKKIVAYHLNMPNGGINVDLGDKAIPSYVQMTIPNGMYFFVGDKPKNNTYQEWFKHTVIAVSSTNTVEATTGDRGAGQGFELTTVKVSDFNFYTETNPANIEARWQSQGTETSIFNACFSVNKDNLSDYPYALSLGTFRYKAKTNDAKHEEVSDMRLAILGHGDKNYLATQKTTAPNLPQFIFKLSSSLAKDGIDLLNTEAKAAIYNIRVMSGTKGDAESLYGKYLTVNTVEVRTGTAPSYVYNDEFMWTAKAQTLVDLAYPAYQFVITEVSGKDVTFTNRETREYFTAKLFPVEGEENVYELGVGATSVIFDDVQAVYVDENTYNEETSDPRYNKPLNRLKIKLEKVAEVDAYAGFLNVDNKSLMTMAFARDSYETSNKFYAAVYENAGAPEQYHLNAYNEFATEVSKAAQWQLIKSSTPMKVVERSFVYNDDDHVTVKAKADVVYAYTYQLRYVVDGQETESFFSLANSSYNYVESDNQLEKDNTYNLSQADKFIIKQNVDGSVSLIAVDVIGTTVPNNSSVFDEDIVSVVAVRSYKDNSGKYVQFYTQPEDIYSLYAYNLNNDWALRTYLIAESPEVSYPAKEGYVQFEGELGNYMSMNENKEGILVNQNATAFYLHVTDKDAVIPSFYISKNDNFLFHAQDSVNYYVADGKYDKKYQWAEETTKAIFKAATIDESRDTLTTNIKGEMREIAVKADDVNTLGGLDRFKVQIVLADDTDDLYVVRSLTSNSEAARYLYAVNDKLTWTSAKSRALKFNIVEGVPTSNESIADAAEGVKVIAGNGTVEIQGAAGKNVVITNVLGKVVASTVLTSDNATIAAPAGIIVVAVDGEEAVKAVVK